MRYPRRNIGDNVRITRFGPSPTGFMHIGGLYAALISERVAHQANGKFILRIEDTDHKRQVDGATELIVEALSHYGILMDEGPTYDGAQVGIYGPYHQSERTCLYQSFVRELLLQGNAYPCFATHEELEVIRNEQTRLKLPPGYGGRWAIWRDRSIEDVANALEIGRDFVIRLRAPDEKGDRVDLSDIVRGQLSFPANTTDVVLLKSDGVPTYHLAHVVDDHLMGTTDVIRGDEWLSSYPLHSQLFALLGLQAPRYAHIAPIEKKVGSSRRKLSKRHDPEASVSWYESQGYPRQAVIEYLLNLADGRFEDWRAANPSAPPFSFQISLERMNRSGALFDLSKLASISREMIGAMSAKAVACHAVSWAKQHDPKLAGLLSRDMAYAEAIFGIERTPPRIRKDLTKWSDLSEDIGYFFDEIFAERSKNREEPTDAIDEFLKPILCAAAEQFDPMEGRDAWLDNLRRLAESNGIAPTAKTYKAAPGNYVGQFSDLTGALRLAITGRRSTPDLFEVMSILGLARVKSRIRHLTN